MPSPPAYHHGMRQPSLRVRFSLELPKAISLEKVDRWIKFALEADIKTYNPLHLNKVSEHSLVCCYLRRLFFVTTILLQDIRVPVFERVAIERIDPFKERTGRYIVYICFPSVNYLPNEILESWLNIANQLVQSTHENSSNPTAIQFIYSNFLSHHSSKWLARIPGGKSTVPILQASFDLGIPFSHLGNGRYLLGWGSESRIFDRSGNSLDSAIGASISHNKTEAVQLLREAGIPTPRGLGFHVNKFSVKLVKNLKFPLVVKPSDKDRGEGVTLGIANEQDLTKAVEHAAKFSSNVLIEEQSEGVCHRILVAGGRVIFAVKRNPKSVIGDGVRSIKALIDAENLSIKLKVPLKRLPLITIDDVTLNTLNKFGFDLDTIPVAGSLIFVRPAQSSQWGGSPIEVTDRLHPENAELAIRAAMLFGLDCAGIDFITEDIAIPWYENLAVINEVNFAPVIGRTHLYQRRGLRAYLKNSFRNHGKIPIEVYVGSEAIRTCAFDRYKQILAQGKKCYFCCNVSAMDHRNHILHFSRCESLGDRIRMIRPDRRMESLVIYIDNAQELLNNGLPFDYITKLTKDSVELLNYDDKKLIAILENYLNKDSN